MVHQQSVPAAGARILAVLAVALLATVAAPGARTAPAYAAERPPAAPVREIPPEAGTPAPATGGSAFRRLCGPSQIEAGNWVNTDTATPGIARIELRDCQPVTTCNGDICTIVHDAGWTTRAFGSCSPTNCDWGWSAGQFRLSSLQIYAFYDQGFARRYVYSAMSQYRPGQLWVYWRTDFVDPNRADYDKQEWFTRAP